MAYIVNTSDKMAVTLNLAQGRVCLQPNSYCELHNTDIDRARKIYNNKELNLCVAETEEELSLLIKLDAENNSEEQIEEVSDSTDKNTSEDQTGEFSEGSNDSSQDSQDSTEDSSDQGSSDQTGESSEGSNDSSQDSTEEDSDRELTPEEAAKKDVLNRIEKYRSEGNLNNLKELATKLQISYGFNIGFEKLAEKIISELGK